MDPSHPFHSAPYYYPQPGLPSATGQPHPQQHQFNQHQQHHPQQQQRLSQQGSPFPEHYPQAYPGQQPYQQFNGFGFPPQHPQGPQSPAAYQVFPPHQQHFPPPHHGYPGAAPAGLPHELDPTYQQPLFVNPANFGRPEDHPVKGEGEGDDDDEKGAGTRKGAKKDRTQHLPPTFSDSEDEGVKSAKDLKRTSASMVSTRGAIQPSYAEDPPSSPGPTPRRSGRGGRNVPKEEDGSPVSMRSSQRRTNGKTGEQQRDRDQRRDETQEISNRQRSNAKEGPAANLSRSGRLEKSASSSSSSTQQSATKSAGIDRRDASSLRVTLARRGQTDQNGGPSSIKTAVGSSAAVVKQPEGERPSDEDSSVKGIGKGVQEENKEKQGKLYGRLPSKTSLSRPRSRSSTSESSSSEGHNGISHVTSGLSSAPGSIIDGSQAPISTPEIELHDKIAAAAAEALATPKLPPPSFEADGCETPPLFPFVKTRNIPLRRSPRKCYIESNFESDSDSDPDDGSEDGLDDDDEDHLRSGPVNEDLSSDPIGEEIPANDARAPDHSDDGEGEDDDDEAPAPVTRQTRSGRTSRVKYAHMGGQDESDSDDVPTSRSKRRAGPSKSVADFVVDDEDAEEEDGEYGARRTRRGRLQRGGGSNKMAALSAKRKKAMGRRVSDDFVVDDFAETSDEDDDISGDETGNSDDQTNGRSYGLRQRKKVDYSLAPPPAEPARDGFGRVIKRNRKSGGSGPSGGAFELDNGRAADLGMVPLPSGINGRKGKTGWDALPLSMSGKDYAQAFGDEVDSSDDDIPTARKTGRPPMLGGNAGGGLLGTGPAPLGGGQGNSGSVRDEMGRIKKGGDALADVDPLGVDMQVDFDSVGGLDGHIQQLKEMVSLPLLYPEVFQRFKVTPPRGVLFHGPPGTGKTLVARALAASCSTSGQQISFFMRKGADCLSKWVGEAERQLRMLFDEARASQPSIIFFDEIDGLAPVRSSKQEQIHASIVSTLLALMDGMDGRGQVVVIGATNRPDSVDPALRRPGRFDREFYFPLPSREARKSIINIHTKGWDPPLSDNFKDKLAEVTKGYGGADMRALCTEAALNAVQRRYPQIYQTNERLLLQPETIKVEAKDFMISVNKIVPSSARSASSSAAPLPDHLRPILGKTVEASIAALRKIMPESAKRNPLEEALWEDEPVAGTSASAAALGGVDDAGFGREMMLRSFESLRIFRPRLLIYGEEGMGQAFIGSALLHHLEGYHVQSMDIGALMGDSARTAEAAVVQLFVEAKRHKPSVLFIPGLVHWANSVSDSVRATTKALLDELSPSDPVLLLAIAEAPLADLHPDVARWFGYLRDNKVHSSQPDESQRRDFFADLIANVAKPPTEFPDALPRRKRVLEELPKAPPRAPRVPTAAEIHQQALDDQRTLELLKFKLGPVLADLRKKYKKFTRDVWDEYNLHNLCAEFQHKREKGKVIVRIRYARGYRPRRQSSVDETTLNGAAARPWSTSRDVSAQPGAPSVVVNSASEGVQTNGDVHMTEEGSFIDGPAPTAQPSQEERRHSQHGAGGAASSLLGAAMHFGSNGAEATANGDAVGSASQPLPEQTPADDWDIANDDPTIETRDMPIWTMNLERMQKRLYYNGYLTVYDFLEDLDKIVRNAQEAQEVDQDRLLRAHQMQNLANILLEQYVELPFREECERMAQRQLQREKEKAEAEDQAKRAVADAARLPRKPSGERFSARVQGQAPEHARPVDVMAIERGGKRSRTSSARVSGGAGEIGSDRKRARSAVVDEADEMIAGLDKVDGQINGAAPVAAAADGGSQAQVAVLADAPTSGLTSDARGGLSGHTNGNAAAPFPMNNTSLGAIGEPASATEPSTAPVSHPTFNCPPASLSALSAHLLTSSATFNIDQLLQLRAACFDSVWRRRSEWDKEPLLAELKALIDEVVRAVQEEKSALAMM